MANTADFLAHQNQELQALQDAGLTKRERIITTPQGARVRTTDGREVINLCANNYLGLSSHPAVIAAAHAALDSHGYGLSSVRFICGTQDLHKTLEARLARFLGMEDAILYAAAFDANGGLFEPLLGEADAIISDELNHVHGRMPQKKNSPYGWMSAGCAPGMMTVNTNVYTAIRSSGLKNDQKKPRTEPR